MTFGSLFAGIGGIDLGLERAGMVCKWQVEIDDYATRVLEKHWPNVRRWRDVRDFPPEPIDEWRVDCIAGGFPCQDISLAGQGDGIDGERSGLWSEFARIVRVLRPSFVLVENVPALLGRGFGRVLGDLAACGFDAEWSVLSACSMGSPHTRERLFVIADNAKVRRSWDCEQNQGIARHNQRRLLEPERKDWWSSEPKMGRVVHGIPEKLDRDRVGVLGNAVVPQVAQWLGERIMESCNEELP